MPVWHRLVALSAAGCLALPPLFSHAADSTPAAASWSWSEPETTILAAKFSPDGQSVVAEVRHVITVGASSGKEFKKRYGKKFAGNPRFADPTIALIRIADGTRQNLGFGFDPVFSPDGRLVAFEQLSPTPEFYFFGTENKPRASNGLAVYDLESKQLRRVAEPTTGHCMRPIFTPDGKSLVYGTPMPESFVRSAYPESLERIDLASGARTTLYARQETRGEAHYLHQFAYVGERLLARRSIAVAQGGPLEFRRLMELIDTVTGAVVYSWGEQEFAGVSHARFARWRDGTTAVYTRQWATVASAPEPQPSKDFRDWLRQPGVLSPDGLLVARGEDYSVVVEDLATGKRVATFDATPDTRGTAGNDPAWSADSKRLVWVDYGVDSPLGRDVLRVEAVR